MEQTNKLIPELRFPEFVKDGEWHLKELKEILDYERPDNYIVVDTNYGNEGTPVLTANKSFVLGYTNETSGIYNNLPAIIFDDFTVDNKYVDFPFKVKSSAIKILKSKGDDNLKFIYELIAQIKFNAMEHKRYYISEYQNLSVNVPNLNEQQKIADCLSSLDELITAHNGKLEALKHHKKGLLQNLFPQEGQKVPNYRFPEFLNDGEWEMTTINNLVPKNEKYGIVDGPFGSNLKTIHYKTEGIPIITSGYVTDGIFKAENYLYVTEEKFNEEKRSAVKGGDIVMAKIGARCGASAIMPIEHRTGILSGNALKITIDELRYSTNFIWQQLWYLHINEKFNGLKSIGAQPAISMASLKKYALIVPKKIEEQQKIAQCLMTVDNLIKAQIEKIEQLKTHKKGLLQGLFLK